MFLSLPTCSPLSCGEPPIVQFASHGLNNSSFLVGELAVYTCDNGFLMVVNSSNSPVATEQVCCQQCQKYLCLYFLNVCVSGGSCVLVIRLLGPNTPLGLRGRLPAWQGLDGVGQPLHQHHLHPACPSHCPHCSSPPSPLLWQAPVLFLSQVVVNQ